MIQKRLRAAILSLAVASGCAAAPAAWAADSGGQSFQLEKGDRVTIIGNTLADRMQHHGWLEAVIQSRFPDRELVFRNIGFAGDELTHRERSDNFGTPDQWLTGTQTDVVFAFFGYNESYGGEKGLDKFKTDLAKVLKDMQAKRYNGESAPRIVLFSPIAFEDHKDPNLPNGAEQNKNLKLYTEAMAEVAKSNDVRFVDLFTPTQALYAKSDKRLTINGVHLSEHGNRLLAPVIAKALFPDAAEAKAADAERLERVRQAVIDKNFYWFQRYRTLDGYNIYGGRSKEAYQDSIHKRKVTNFEVMQREMHVLDAMTANRDPAVWAAAQGKDFKVDDTKTPELIPVGTNRPGKGPDGTHVYLGGEEAIARMKLGKGLKVNLFADEKQFPDLINPVQMAWDTKGRLWVATWPSYPHWKPKDPLNDKLLILEDTDGDGRADKSTVFADGLNCTTGFEFYNGGVLVAQAPSVLFMKDTNGDDKADVTERVIDGIDSADSHHTANSFVFDPGGALYFQEGTFHHSQVETAWGPPERVTNGGVFRYEPRTHKFEVFTSYGFANPHGHVFDYWGTNIITDGTGAQPYYGPAFTGKTYYPQKHSGKAPLVYKQRTRPCPATEILSSKHFPEEMQGDYLVANVIGFQGILRYDLKEKGAGLVGTETDPLISSDDPNFRPSDLEIGPDGALYFTDWQNAIIGHLQHHLRDSNRDHTHGRVYRITAEGRDLLKPTKLAGEPVEKLVELLKERDDRVRYRAKIELSSRDPRQVLAAVDKWLGGLDKSDPAYAHHQTEALWMYQWNNVVNEDLLKQVLRSPEPMARAAATRVLCYWRDRVKEPLALLKVQAGDEHPRVRLEAVRACSFFTTPEAVDVALESLNHPDDEYLKYTLEETMKTLERVTKDAKGGKGGSGGKAGKSEKK